MTSPRAHHEDVSTTGANVRRVTLSGVGPPLAVTRWAASARRTVLSSTALERPRLVTDVLDGDTPAKATLRRRELATAAQATLADLGYARTSLRDIAAGTDFSHGLFHYYFEDKHQLVLYSVSLYKQECATRYDEVVGTSRTPDELLEGFGAALEASLRDDAAQHRLWYDLRNQSLFDQSFREGVAAIDALLEDMVWRVLSRFAELSSRAASVDPRTAYALFDGLFLHALTAFSHGDTDAPDRLRAAGVALIPALAAEEPDGPV